MPKRTYITGTPEERFWFYVNKDGPGGCWLWTASTACGYGQIKVGKKVVRVHRFAYQLLVGDIPDGLQLDHLCRVLICCNPAHLEPVTNRENVLRGLTARGKSRARSVLLSKPAAWPDGQLPAET